MRVHLKRVKQGCTCLFIWQAKVPNPFPFALNEAFPSSLIYPPIRRGRVSEMAGTKVISIKAIKIAK